jgi:predicted amidohydrolase
MKTFSTSGNLNVALGEYDTGWHDPDRSMSSARQIGREARSAGADLLVLPEMCATGFTMEAEEFADDPDGPSVKALSSIASENALWVVAGLSMRKAGRYVNSALAFAPDGSLAASYDKQRLFGFAEETGVYSAGAGPCLVSIAGLSVALFVCFDLRFPELFREVTGEADALVVVANWPTTRREHWDILTRARAIENQCYMIAVNRTGEGGGLAYNGGSVILDPWGKRIDAPAQGSALRTAAVSRRTVGEIRQAFPLGVAAPD